MLPCVWAQRCGNKLDTSNLSGYSPMIKSFRHKGLEQFFVSGATKGINTHHAAKLRRLLVALHTAEGPENMNHPGYKLHPLHGNRKGSWAVWVSGNWRLVFAFDGMDAIQVDLVDYH